MSEQFCEECGQEPQCAEGFGRCPACHAKNEISALRKENEELKAELNKSLFNFQKYVWVWVNDCLGNSTATDVSERNFRFLEEALELVQSSGATKDDAYKLVDYVFSRDKGAPHQEVGGVMVTLAALCGASNLDLNRAAIDEYHRINQPEIKNKIRLKHESKPRKSPLPGDYKYADRGGEQ